MFLKSNSKSFEPCILGSLAVAMQDEHQHYSYQNRSSLISLKRKVNYNEKKLL